MSLKLKTKVNDFLVANPNKKYTAREIAEYIFETFPKECEEKKNRSKATVIPIDTNEALVSQLVAEISSYNTQFKKENIKITDERPRKYYYSTLSDEEEIAKSKDSENIIEIKIEEVAQSQIKPILKEHDLYPLLTIFLESEFCIFSKRIDEKRSKNDRGNGGNHWLYPDLVGLENLSLDWHKEVAEAAIKSFDKLVRIWSFEVKKSINLSNVRECYFQAVSNSSWANFGYLVASEIGGNVLKELRILSGLHGIGFINLDVENPTESTILIPAREKNNIDWNTANRIAEQNKDFADFVEKIKEFYQTNKVKPFEWDNEKAKKEFYGELED